MVQPAVDEPDDDIRFTDKSSHCLCVGNIKGKRLCISLITNEVFRLLSCVAS
jgi:hypothetical protein